MIILLLYVDDIILTGSNDTQVQQVIDSLAEIFELKDMGPLTYFLGLQIQCKQNGDLPVHQSKYTKELLKKAGMETCTPHLHHLNNILNCMLLIALLSRTLLSIAV